MIDQNRTPEIPDNTAVRTALWRALHLEVDLPPHVFCDDIGLKLVAPDANWRSRPDMDPQFIAPARASILARARYVEDLVTKSAGEQIAQYVILGAGLDTFTQRRPDIAAQIRVFEVDRPETQNWKRRRLVDLGYGVASNLHFVAVDFEKTSWWDALNTSGFDRDKPTLVSSLGVSMYLTREAVMDNLRKLAALAPGSKFAMTYLLPIEQVEEWMRPLQQIAMKGAAAAGTPFLSFFMPDEMTGLAREAGFKDVQIVSGDELNRLYFDHRTDGLRTSNGEQILIAGT